MAVAPHAQAVPDKAVPPPVRHSMEHVAMGLTERLHKRWAERGLDVPVATANAPTDLVEDDDAIPDPVKPKRKRAPKVFITGHIDSPVGPPTLKQHRQFEIGHCRVCNVAIARTKLYCETHRAEARVATNRRLQEQRRRPVQVKQCDECGAMFLTTRARQRLCSPDCRKGEGVRKFVARRQSGELIPSIPFLCRCGGSWTVVDSRQTGDGIRRRRECTTCGTRVTTRETIVDE